MSDELREEVRTRYAAAALTVLNGTGAATCGPDSGSCAPTPDAAAGTADSTAGGPSTTSSTECCGPAQVSLPTAVSLEKGAEEFGGPLYADGVDMTDEMLELARANAAKAGASNVEFRKGQIEDVPLPDGSVDVVISNCVINLSTDKPKVLSEMFRVLSPGGRIGIADVVAEDHMSPADRAVAGSYVGCIAGALSRAEYLAGLAAAGFADGSVELTHEAVPGMHSAIIRAVKPVAA